MGGLALRSPVRLGVVAARDATSRKFAAEAGRILRTLFPTEPLRSDLGPPAPDVLVAIGDDHFLLQVLRKVAAETAVLGVGGGFLAETPPEKLDEALRTFAGGDYWIEERLRLEVHVDGRRLAPALNEAVLSTSRGGGFLRYTLEIDGERLWRDAGDGVIVCTPTGSTGYGLSAGGPIVMENSEAFVVVPVCSSTGQRPVVVPSRSVITIGDIESRLGRDLVLDGHERVRVQAKGFTIQSSEHPARFVRFGKARYLRVFGKLHAVQKALALPASAPPSVKFLFRLLEDHGPLTEKQLIGESGLPERTVRNALSFLIRSNLVRRSASLRDAREAVFRLRP